LLALRDNLQGESDVDKLDLPRNLNFDLKKAIKKRKLEVQS